jgi:hypothetical protein
MKRAWIKIAVAATSALYVSTGISGAAASDGQAVGTCLITIEADEERTAHQKKCQVGDEIALVTNLIHIKVTILEHDAEVALQNPGFVFFDERTMNKSETRRKTSHLIVYDTNSPDYTSGLLNKPVATIQVLFSED